MAIDRAQSLKERRAAKKTRTVLIGRKQQQDWFERSLLQPEHGDAKTIFSISGQGGIGKTTLLREFRRIAEENGALCGYVNEGVAMNPVNDVPEVMWRLVEDLEQGQGVEV